MDNKAKDGASRLTQFLANTGWRNEARAASLVVRRAKAAARKAAEAKRKEEEAKTQGAAKRDHLADFEADGLAGMSPEAVEALTDELRSKLIRETELTPAEVGFLEALAESGYAGEGDDDPVFKWQEQQSQRERKVEAAMGMGYDEARAKADAIEQKRADGKPITAEERKFLEQYQSLMKNAATAAAAAVVANAGWTDGARVAALAVRRAKAKRRGVGRANLGGSAGFDERTGKAVRPPQPGDPRQIVAAVREEKAARRKKAGGC